MRDAIGKGPLARDRRGIAASAVAAIGAVLLLWSTAAFADPAKSLLASEVTGCCVCRGTNGGDTNVLRSCSDGTKVEACVSQCKAQGAGSIVFGRNQTCSQGCAGFPTQGLH